MSVDDVDRKSTRMFSDLIYLGVFVGPCVTLFVKFSHTVSNCKLELNCLQS